ncbi:MAG: TetR/AcrR family transcriptional regulator [Capnocytophaga sp.]|nr:TetR/AcrR family transcriptional regulator [Capnocytophaga sp.]
MGKLEFNKKRNESIIIAAADKLFAEKGIEATTISDIVKESGLARGTFYNYYKNKEEIWDRIIDDAMMEISNKLKEERQKASNIREFVYNSFIALAWILQEETYLRFIMNNQTVLRKTLLSSEFLNPIYTDLENDFLNSSFYEGLAPSTLRMFGYSFVGATIELIFQSYMNNDTMSPEEKAEFFTGLFIGGYKQLTHTF